MPAPETPTFLLHGVGAQLGITCGQFTQNDNILIHPSVV